MSKHVTVLLKEATEALGLKEGDIFLDGTLGGGGHSALVAQTFGNKVRIIALDRDQSAIEQGERLRTLSSSVELFQESFRNLDQVLEELGVRKVNAILFDLGLSSDQIEDSGRGFSFQRDEPLKMTMGGEGPVTAEVIVNSWDEETLELILRGFGEEKFSKRIAKEIVERRELKPFKTTFDLVEAVRAATPGHYHHGKLHPATRTFQALRIAVNEELATLEEGLAKGFGALAEHGRFAVISFHSLEDRIVKNFFREKSKAGEGIVMTKKPIIPGEEEVERNPRSRSAKLRVIEKL
jgi:16S rRNA (cytosine1402-N4)-methyltransferase